MNYVLNAIRRLLAKLPRRACPHGNDPECSRDLECEDCIEVRVW